MFVDRRLCLHVYNHAVGIFLHAVVCGEVGLSTNARWPENQIPPIFHRR